jgi:hypothetical protein
MNDFGTTCSLFSKEYFGEELTTEKVSSSALADVAGYNTYDRPYEARISAVEAVKSDLNNRGVDKYDDFLTDIREVYITLRNRSKSGVSILTSKLRDDVDQNFKKFLKGVDGSEELSKLL